MFVVELLLDHIVEDQPEIGVRVRCRDLLRPAGIAVGELVLIEVIDRVLGYKFAKAESSGNVKNFDAEFFEVVDFFLCDLKSVDILEDGPTG